MKIAVDGMGGDHAPSEIVKGCVEAARVIGAGHEIYIAGIEDAIKRELKKYRFNSSQIKIVHAGEVITNEEAPVMAARKKKDSSMIKGLSLVKTGQCDVMISGGSTGALMAGSLFMLGRIRGIERPAIGMTYPVLGKGVSFLLDAGANAECRVINLVEFAEMGSIYMSRVMGIENPTVGLINIGVEEKKGTPTIREAYQALKESDLNFTGNVEAREIPFGAADVLVCDGFTGNTVLKLTEGLAQKFMDVLKEMLMDGPRSKMGALFLSRQLKELKEEFDYSEYGGAPILGVRGPVLKIHGSSDANAVKNAIIKAIPFVEQDVIGLITESVERKKKAGEESLRESEESGRIESRQPEELSREASDEA